MADLHEIDRMTFWEYQLRMKAYRMRMVDTEYLIYLQAWVNRGVNAEKKNGKKTIPVYKEFTEFFDYEDRINQVLGKPDRKMMSETAGRYIDFVKERRREGGKL